jgi:hypothetical protein
MAKRYIDADELELEYYGLSIHGTMAVKSVLPVFAELLKEQQTADVVEVVKCSECKYKDDCARQMVHTTRDYVLEQNISTYNKVDFCSYGEKRRTDDD